ncbi:hypothetical protein ElyMa_006169200 [Elysia marginata]|uniref:Uncharacterized protein n=1 Tax=Elysia marginata TaxID=1093978 RepID=A0AAV4H0X0_9GAST|nr:hypothetical protein ElyMa_006169200 [Elysia marginata]
MMEILAVKGSYIADGSNKKKDIEMNPLVCLTLCKVCDIFRRSRLVYDIISNFEFQIVHSMHFCLMKEERKWKSGEKIDRLTYTPSMKDKIRVGKKEEVKEEKEEEKEEEEDEEEGGEEGEKEEEEEEKGDDKKEIKKKKQRKRWRQTGRDRKR